MLVRIGWLPFKQALLSSSEERYRNLMTYSHTRRHNEVAGRTGDSAASCSWLAAAAAAADFADVAADAVTAGGDAIDLEVSTRHSEKHAQTKLPQQSCVQIHKRCDSLSSCSNTNLT